MQRAYIAHLNFLFNLSFIRNMHKMLIHSMWDDYIQRIRLWKLRSLNLCTPTFRFLLDSSKMDRIYQRALQYLILFLRFRVKVGEKSSRYGAKNISANISNRNALQVYNTKTTTVRELYSLRYDQKLYLWKLQKLLQSVVNFLYPVSKTFHIPCLSSDKIRNVLRIFFSYCKLHPPPILSRS